MGGSNIVTHVQINNTDMFNSNIRLRLDGRSQGIKLISKYVHICSVSC